MGWDVHTYSMHITLTLSVGLRCLPGHSHIHTHAYR